MRSWTALPRTRSARVNATDVGDGDAIGAVGRGTRRVGLGVGSGDGAPLGGGGGEGSSDGDGVGVAGRAAPHAATTRHASDANANVRALMPVRECAGRP